MSVRRAQREIDSREFAEWIAFEDMSPGYPERGDLNAAFICTTIANAMSGKKGRRHNPQQFMPEFRTRLGLPTMKELKMKLGAGLRMAKNAIENKRRKRGG